MPNETKGITVKIDAGLHAQVREYVESHGMTMAEFVSRALDNELHPQNNMKEMNTMPNSRTIAFQVPEELFQRIKDYLARNNMTQRQFFLGLIEAELERDQAERNSLEEDEPAQAGAEAQETDARDHDEAAAHSEEQPDGAEQEAPVEEPGFEQTM